MDDMLHCTIQNKPAPCLCREPSITINKDAHCRAREQVGDAFRPQYQEISGNPFWGLQKVPTATYANYTDVFVFAQGAVESIQWLPPEDKLPGTGIHVERWSVYMDGRGLRVGDRPKLHETVRKKARKNNADDNMQSVVFGIRPIHTALGHDAGNEIHLRHLASQSHHGWHDSCNHCYDDSHHYADSCHHSMVVTAVITVITAVSTAMTYTFTVTQYQKLSSLRLQLSTFAQRMTEVV